MGSPEISVPFLDFIHEKGANIIVFTQKDKVRGRGKKLIKTPVKQRAEELDIPAYDMSIKSGEAYEILESFEPDLYLVVAYGQILPKRVLDLPKIAPFNVHFSLLPEYRGATPVNSSIMNGDEKTGTTIMFMDRGMDTGDIVYIEEENIAPEDNATTLFEKLIKRSVNILDKNWNEISDNSFGRTPQQGEPTYTSLITKDDLMIPWEMDAEPLLDRIRSLTDEPGVRTIFRNRYLAVEKASLGDGSGKVPGEIIEVTKKQITVACGSGSIRIERVKPEGKKSMDMAAFLNGYRPEAGEKLSCRRDCE